MKCDDCQNQGYDGNSFNAEAEIVCKKKHWAGWNDYGDISMEEDENGDPFASCVDFVAKENPL